ncbi:hypothetical protein [Priestia taiwanensis]|uniref:DUF4129 domain-containing protein n=1 Tax=Priestia taiwanensis TaxID=1347902 RepID=A0A917AT20_9BACI|nr:hypothetical protein [Priestia taiwanensis]MBM7363170.1 hypothetical protein [Priestia taiwanensis]GGE68259.1 hypothetical protein GCM10007140_17900 [Priestia taiwanensis]
MNYIYQVLTYVIAYISFGQVDKLGVFFVFLCTSLIFLHVMKGIISSQPNAFYVLSVVQFATMWYFLSLSIPSLFFFTILFYIMYGDIRKERFHYITASFFFLCISLLIDGSEAYLLLFSLFGVQTVLYLMITSKTIYERKWKLISLGFLSICTISVVYALPIIQAITKVIFQQLAAVFFYLLYYIMLFLGPILPIEPLEATEEFKDQFGKMQVGVEEDADQKAIFERSAEMEYISIILTVIFIALVAYFIVKKMKKSKKELALSSGTNSLKETVYYQKEIKQRPPKNPIRNKVFHLEKNMKNSYARRKGETFEQWMNRLREIQKFPEGSDDIAHIYNRVRYGDETASKEEVARLNEFYKEIRRRGKDARE